MADIDIDEVKKKFDLAETSENSQRKREREDLAFYEGEGQWPAELAELRKGFAATAGVPATPAKPTLTINKVKDPIRHTINEFLQADLGISIIPADDFEGEPIDESEIELREGLVRRYQRQSQANESRLWAVSRAEICGRGFYGVMTRDMPGKTFDQEIYYRRFFNQFSVLLDPAHEEPDGSDAKWAFVGQDLPWDTYKAECGHLADGEKNPIIRAQSDWRALGDDAPKWFTLEDGKIKSVRVVEYWYTEYQHVEYVLMEDGSILEATELDSRDLKKIPKNRRKRDVVRRIKFCKLDGKNVLEETDWEGKYIPIIKVIGEEIHPFESNGERRCEGMIRSAIGPQRAFNYMVSAAVEMIGAAPNDPVIGAAGQFESFEPAWDAAAMGRAIRRLEYNAEVAGKTYGPPSRQGKEPPIQAMAQMMAAFSVAIKDTTGIPDPTLGNVDPNARSGKAIRAMLEQALRGTSNYMANAIRSAHYEGQIVNDLLYPVLMRAGRRVRMMTGSRTDTTPAMLGVPFVIEQGRAVPFDATKHQGQQPKTYTLTEKPVNVTIKVSKHYDTRRQQEAEQLAELITANPEFMTWFGDLFFDNQDSPGHQELAKRAKAMLAPPIQKLLSEGKQDDPKVAQLQQQLEAVMGELQKQMADKGAKIESAKIKAGADTQQNESDNQTKFLIAQMQEFMESQRAAMDREVKLAVAEIGAKVDRMSLFLEERARLGLQSHEAEQADADRAHEVGMAGVEHQQNLEAGDQQHAQNLEAGEQEHGQAIEQQATAAALAPEPAEAGE